MICNRDERRARPPAAPPQVRWLWPRTAVFPLDPLGGGTWIGANDAGIVLALLNAQSPQSGFAGTTTPVHSRGLLIPSLLRWPELAGVADAVADVDPTIYQPFRLVAVQRHRGFEFASTGQTVVATAFRLDRPILFTSSSLGGVQAARLRAPLFESMVVGAPDSWLAGQMRFHEFQFKGNTAFGIRMNRAEARTVSRSIVDIDSTRVRMEYEPLPEETTQ
jgi:hypothetical protein